MMGNWENNAIQFPRLLAEIYAVGLTAKQEEELCLSMDLDRGNLYSLLERAQEVWDKIKSETTSGGYPRGKKA